MLKASTQVATPPDCPPENNNAPLSICVKDITAHCDLYKGAELKSSIFQLVTTLALFFGNLALMFYALSISYWITALLTLPAAGLLTRIFIFQHDCGHRSFFHSKKANDWVGRGLSLLTATPYDFWRRAHNMHHATSGDLDRRSIGGIDTVTVREYQNMSKKQQFFYKLYRNPLVLLIIGTPVYVLIIQRLPFTQGTGFYENYKGLSSSSIRKSILLTNLFLLIAFGTVGALIGFLPLLAIYLPILVVTTWAGGWLFFVQHQFEDTYWEKHAEWNLQEAALMGSSYYHLPRILQWFTGNIGLHHIHHLCSKIPNYKLQKCMDDRPELKDINHITLSKSLKSLKLKLWDEEKSKLVSFKEI